MDELEISGRTAMDERTPHEKRFLIAQATMSMHRSHSKQWTDGKVCRFCRHYFEHGEEDCEGIIEGWYCEKDVPPDQFDEEGNELPDFDIETIWYRKDENPHLCYLLTCPEWRGNP